MEEWIIKSEGISFKGTYPGSRSIETLLDNGIVILDKWPGPTSHDVTATVRKVLGIEKTAHSGTLDPQVSGVLPIMLGNACKMMPALQKLDKEYIGVMHLHDEPDKEKLEASVKKLTGKVRQKPPVRSAVARKERERNIYSFDILDMKGRNVAFRVVCEAGTYIRKLVSDLGKMFKGAHMRELRRTRAGPFDESRAVKIHDLVDAYLAWKENKDESIREFVLPVEAAAGHIKKIIIKDSAIPAVANGSPLYTGGISRIEKGIKPGDLVAIFTMKGEVVALAKAAMRSEENKKGLAAKTDRVIMKSL